MLTVLEGNDDLSLPKGTLVIDFGADFRARDFSRDLPSGHRHVSEPVDEVKDQARASIVAMASVSGIVLYGACPGFLILAYRSPFVPSETAKSRNTLPACQCLPSDKTPIR